MSTGKRLRRLTEEENQRYLKGGLHEAVLVFCSQCGNLYKNMEVTIHMTNTETAQRLERIRQRTYWHEDVIWLLDDYQRLKEALKELANNIHSMAHGSGPEYGGFVCPNEEEVQRLTEELSDCKKIEVMQQTAQNKVQP